MSATVPDSVALKTILGSALERLYRVDAFLLENPVSERAIAHRLACHMDAFLPVKHRLHVDTEYNRMTKEGLAQIVKRLPDLKGWGEEGKSKRGDVQPDIILHYRPDAEHNALVLEVKLAGNRNEDDRAWDMAKLEEFTARRPPGLGYRLGCFLDLGPATGTGVWFVDGKCENGSGEPETLFPGERAAAGR